MHLKTNGYKITFISFIYLFVAKPLTTEKICLFKSRDLEARSSNPAYFNEFVPHSNQKALKHQNSAVSRSNLDSLMRMQFD